MFVIPIVLRAALCRGVGLHHGFRPGEKLALPQDFCGFVPSLSAI
jgi:hypothetical protein